MPRLPEILAGKSFLIAATLSLALAGCSGVSAPSTGGPSAPAGGTGFTTAAATQLWLQQFGTGTTEQITSGVTSTTGIFNEGDILTGIAVDLNDNVAVSGYTFGAFPGFSNPNHVAQDFVAKFDSTGKQLWLQQFGTGPSDYLNAVVTDAAGNIFAAGFTTGVFSGATNTIGSPQAVVVKLDANGNQLWLRQFSSGIAIRAVTAVADGSLLIAGVLAQQIVQPAGGQVQLTSQQAFVAKLNSTGQIVWQQTIGQSGITILNAIAADIAGNAYLAGEAEQPAGSQPNAGSIQLLAIKLSAADGSLIWQQGTVAGSNAAFESFLRGIAIDPEGNAVVSGIVFGANKPSSFIAKLSGGSGQQIWSTSFGGATSTVANNVGVDAAGNIVVAGSTYAALLPQFQPLIDDVYLAKFNSSGQNIWLQQFGTGNELSAANLIVGPLPSANQLQIAVDQQGNTFLGGITSGQFPGFNNPNQALEPFVAKFGP